MHSIIRDAISKRLPGRPEEQAHHRLNQIGVEKVVNLPYNNAKLIRHQPNEKDLRLLHNPSFTMSMHS
jgi:hypothetical protein